MLTDSYIKYLLCDDDCLNSYYHGNPVALNDVKRSMLLIERRNNILIPDHYYRLGLERSFSDISTLADLFVTGLGDLADYYLDYYDNHLFVQADKQNEWQLFLPYMPPLIAIAAKIRKHNSPLTKNPNEYIKDHVASEVSHTALLSPYVPELNNFKRESRGLNDLHIHLNGSLETDTVWQDFLQHPMEVSSNLSLAQSNEKVKELYLQVTRFYEPKDFDVLLSVAIELRKTLSQIVLSETLEATLDGNVQFGQSFDSYLLNILDSKANGEEHPLSLITSVEVSDVQRECYLYIRVIDYLAYHRNNNVVAGLFHYYLLILGLTNRMLVQQPTLFGFEEFQKYTLNGFRGWSENKYDRRFSQLAGNALDNIAHIEGRFAPKTTLHGDVELINRIKHGFDVFQKNCKERGVDSNAKLSLVAHFIKRPELKRDDNINFFDLRVDLRRKTAALINLKKSKSSQSNIVVGIDAASSEFDTPPEVFAESYKKLREECFDRFTYHAGEDFYHVLSGLRAIYEAVLYLGLRPGDRIGHAVASGISVALWRKNIGDKLLIRKGEYMDDLVFAYYLISGSSDDCLKQLLPVIALRIEDYGYDIYGDYYPVSMFIAAWKLRGEIPEEMVYRERAQLTKAENLYVKYHNKYIRKKYDEIIVVDTYDILDEGSLMKMQLLILKYLHDKDLVIETLPTSNVIIGHHHDFSTYHLYNWWKWGKEGFSIPPIVVGTDDAGIFATNIYNEYCNIFCMLKYHKNMNSNDIITFIRQLDESSRIYAF